MMAITIVKIVNEKMANKIAFFLGAILTGHNIITGMLSTDAPLAHPLFQAMLELTETVRNDVYCTVGIERPPLKLHRCWGHTICFTIASAMSCLLGPNLHITCSKEVTVHCH